MITVKVGDIYFNAAVPCGRSWPGMIGTDDVRIVLDRAMAHVKNCPDCAPDVAK